LSPPAANCQGSFFDLDVVKLHSDRYSWHSGRVTFFIVLAARLGPVESLDKSFCTTSPPRHPVSNLPAKRRRC
jgi:hypothetical protein